MEFLYYSGKRFYGWIHPDFHPPTEVLEHPEQVSSLPGAQCILECQGRQIHRLVLKFRDQSVPCFTYYFRNTSWNRSLRPSYAFRTFRVAQLLQQKGVETLEIIAALKNKKEILNWHSLVVAREIAPTFEIASGGSHVFQIHPVVEFTSEIASSLARQVAKLHRHGFFHGDLKTRHILVKPRAHSDDADFFFVDLEKCHYFPVLPNPVRDVLATRDLIQLFASLPPEGKKLKGAFLENYFQASALPSLRRRRVQRLLKFYEPAGTLAQGQTLAAGLWRRLRD